MNREPHWTNWRLCLCLKGQKVVTEYPELERTQQGSSSPTPSSMQDNPKIKPYVWEYCLIVRERLKISNCYLWYLKETLFLHLFCHGFSSCPLNFKDWVRKKNHNRLRAWLFILLPTLISLPSLLQSSS